MFIGVNTNLKHKGEIFHIQTEDGGLDQHTLTTILFKNGAILSSKKTSYIDIPKSLVYNEKIKEMMQEQHKQMARDLFSGKIKIGTALMEEPNSESQALNETREVLKKVPVSNPLEGRRMPPEPKHMPARVNGLDGLIFDYLAKKKTSRL